MNPILVIALLELAVILLLCAVILIDHRDHTRLLHRIATALNITSDED